MKFFLITKFKKNKNLKLLINNKNKIIKKNNKNKLKNTKIKIK